jgi:uncharacterized protein involved in response to NO
MLVVDRLPRGVPAAVDLAFLPALTIACARPVLSSQNRRNYQFVLMLAALFLANLGMHLGALGVAPTWMPKGARLGTYVVIVMIVVMTARVVPMFTRNATGVKTISSWPRLDTAAVLAVVAGALLDVFGLDERAVAGVSALAGVLVLARMAPWGSLHTLKNPLLWSLHAGHAFVGLGLLLRGIALVVPAVTASAALHALTAGAVGSLTLGMMARVSLGHTGRMLAVKPAVGVAFGLMVLAGLVRTFGPLGGLTAYAHSMTTAGVLFAAAFAVFLVVYFPVLVAPRVDGKPG